MTKRLGLTLVVVGLGMQVLDLLTTKDAQGGILFGPEGILKGIDAAVPKVTIPGLNVQTNVAFWVIAAGAAIWLLKR